MKHVHLTFNDYAVKHSPLSALGGFGQLETSLGDVSYDVLDNLYFSSHAGEIKVKGDLVYVAGAENHMPDRMVDYVFRNPFGRYSLRISKTDQQAYIHCIGGEIKNAIQKDSLNQLKWHCVKTHVTHHAPSNQKLLIKPQHGARGIGHLIIDPSKVNLLSLWEKDLLSLKPSNDKIGENEFNLDLLESNIKKIEEKYQGAVKFHRGQERYPWEGVRSIGFDNFIGSFCIQEYIEDIEEEYRAFTNSEGRLIWAVKRHRKKINGYSQVGVEDDDVHRFDETISISDLYQSMGSLTARFFSALIKNAVSPFSSVDIFKRANGDWGIFEFSNEMSVLKQPNEAEITIAHAMIREWVELYLKSPSRKRYAF